MRLSTWAWGGLLEVEEPGVRSAFFSEIRGHGHVPGGKAAAWLVGLLEDLGIELQTPLILYGDNLGCARTCAEPYLSPAV